MSLTIRKAVPADALPCATVLNEVIAEGTCTLFDKPFSEADERAFITALGDRRALFVAELDGAIAGLQSVDLFANYADSVRHVATIGTWLKRDARGRGIGTRLAAESFAFARAHDYSKVMISVLAMNVRALSFYRRLGFTDIGVARRHVRLGGIFHDEVYLEKLL